MLGISNDGEQWRTIYWRRGRPPHYLIYHIDFINSIINYQGLGTRLYTRRSKLHRSCSDARLDATTLSMTAHQSARACVARRQAVPASEATWADHPSVWPLARRRLAPNACVKAFRAEEGPFASLADSPLVTCISGPTVRSYLMGTIPKILLCHSHAITATRPVRLSYANLSAVCRSVVHETP